MPSNFYRNVFYKRLVRAINVDVSVPNTSYRYIISGPETGTVFTARGSEGENSYPLIFILPPIKDFFGSVFTFKAGPTTELYVFPHTGLASSSYANYEAFSRDQLGFLAEGDFGLTAFLTQDTIAYPGQEAYSYLHWHSSYGGTNSTITVQATRATQNNAWASEESGVWTITENIGTIQVQDSVPNYGQSSYDWFEMEDRFPTYGGNTYSEADVENGSQASTISNIFIKEHKGTANYTKNGSNEVTYENIATLTKTSDYALSASETGYKIDNTGATNDVIITLPSAEAGLCFWFIVKTDDTYNFRIQSASGDYIQGYSPVAGQEDGTEVYASKANSFIRLVAYDNTNWHFWDQNPAWTLGSP